MNLEPQQGMVQPANPVYPPKRPAGASETQWSGPVFTESAYDAGYAAGRADVLENGDGYHTFDGLYEARTLYHSAFVNELHIHGPYTVKSRRHSNGEVCFGGGWFIVVTNLPNGHGQISQHYKDEDWDLFQVTEVETPPAFDDHTTADVHARLRAYLTGDPGEANTKLVEK